jgi:hypothetical protein
LLLDIPELIIDGQGGLPLGALVTRLNQLSLVIPSIKVNELASRLQIQALCIERNPESDLIPAFILSISEKAECCIAFNFHF